MRHCSTITTTVWLVRGTALTNHQLNESKKELAGFLRQLFLISKEWAFTPAPPQNAFAREDSRCFAWSPADAYSFIFSMYATISGTPVSFS